MAKRNFDDKFWNDKHGNLAVWQRPNIPLIVWIVTVILGMILSDGPLQRDIGWIGLIAILIWAVMELGWGVSYFRRLLGFAVLLLAVVVSL
jgi:hypothetical protein